MSLKLRQYLVDAYSGSKEFITSKIKRDFAIQIDDQDDNDDITEFCTMFVTVVDRNQFVFELIGSIPLNQEIVDLAEIYGGSVDRDPGRIMIKLTVNQIEVLMDLARHIRKTSRQGNTINNPRWHRVSARTISSIYRFVRTIKEYTRIKGQMG
jgi:hypothetical protein